MVYDMEFRADTLYQIKTFETAGINAHFNYYAPVQFLNMWNANGYVGYRYNKLIYSSNPIVIQDWNPIVYNDYLCPSKGDKAVYRTTDTVVIDIFDSSYNQIVLAKGATMDASESYSGDTHSYYGLQPGIYTVFLQNGDLKTPSASFEIVDTDVYYSWSDDGEYVIIHFDTHALPEYAALCRQTGSSLCYPISELDRWRGYITVPRWANEPEYYCKVIFKGEYGRIINEPIRVE